MEPENGTLEFPFAKPSLLGSMLDLGSVITPMNMALYFAGDPKVSFWVGIFKFP